MRYDVVTVWLRTCATVGAAGLARIRAARPGADRAAVHLLEAGACDYTAAGGRLQPGALRAHAPAAGAAAAATGIRDPGSDHCRGMRPEQSRFRHCTYKAHLLKLVLLFVQVRPLGYNLNWVRMLHLGEPRGDPRCQRYTSTFVV